jgi:hypothetical protein
MRTLAQRIRLKRSIEDESAVATDETALLSDTRSKSRHRLSEILRDPLAVMQQAPCLGDGVYGDVHQLFNANLEGVAALKAIGCQPWMAGDVRHSPFRSENSEPALVRLLWDSVAEQGASPHLIAPFGSHVRVTGTMKKRRALDDGIEESVVYAMESATSTLFEHLVDLRGQILDLHLEVILFQICYTMHAIFMRFPDFRHNDLTETNVLVYPSAAEGYNRYEVDGTTFWIPAIGVMSLISDFDFASIRGSIENYKCLEQAWDTPSFGINSRCDHQADMYHFVNRLRRSFRERFSNGLTVKLESLYGRYRSFNDEYCPPARSWEFPTPRQILSSPLFEHFRIVPTEPIVCERFSAAVPVGWTLNDAVVRLLPLECKELRHCPIFRPRLEGVKSGHHLPALCYLARCAPAGREEEEEEEEEGEDWSYFEQHLRYVYHYGEQDDILPVHRFAPERCDQCLDRVKISVESFLLRYHVPRYWICALYTCAFVESIARLGVVKDKQRCWIMQYWQTYWARTGAADYEEMELLHCYLIWNWLN